MPSLKKVTKIKHKLKFELVTRPAEGERVFLLEDDFEMSSSSLSEPPSSWWDSKSLNNLVSSSSPPPGVAAAGSILTLNSPLSGSNDKTPCLSAKSLPILSKCSLLTSDSSPGDAGFLPRPSSCCGSGLKQIMSKSSGSSGDRESLTTSPRTVLTSTSGGEKGPVKNAFLLKFLFTIESR